MEKSAGHVEEINGRKTSPDIHESSSSDDMEASKPENTAAVDQGMKVFVEYDGDREWTKEEEKRVVRKIDWSLLVLVPKQQRQPQIISLCSSPKQLQ